MGKTITKNNVTTTTVTVDKVGLWIVMITVIIIVIVVITGISVRFALSDEHLSSIILISLICFLVLLGIVVLTILAARRKKFVETETKVITLRKGPYRSIQQPSAPQEETSWEYSNRATVPA